MRNFDVVLIFAACSLAPAYAADRSSLTKALETILERPLLKSSRVSAQMQSLDDGSIVWRHNPDELLNPASNMKLVTSATALAKLGPDFRFETEFLTEPHFSSGKVKALYVRGKGDPSLTTEKLHSLAAELYHAGLREVGDLWIDDSWFDAERLAPGYDQETSDRAYMAPTGAVSLNWNSAEIFLKPGEKAGSKALIELEPSSDYFAIENNLKTVGRQNPRYLVTSEYKNEKQHILVRGTLPADRRPIAIWKKIDNPPVYFGFTFKQVLTEHGIKVRGRVKLGAAPANFKPLYVAQSDTFDLILKRLNKHSSNFVAEQLLKTVGAQVKGPPGSTGKGVEVVEEFLSNQVGIPRGSYVMKNGSGLNDINRFSASQFNRLLRYMYERLPLSPEYISSVGIAAKDGTLRYRFEGSDAAGRLRAKTGTLENVSALSGYVQSVGGERFTFSILVNDFSGRVGPIVQSIDAMGVALAAYGSSNGPVRAVAQQIQAQTEVVGSLTEARNRIQTYLTLEKEADARNIPFLRTAWRTERDPAAKAVLAESLYQSNPEDPTWVRTLLESFSTRSEVLGRLEEVAKQLKIEVPCVASIADLAAMGNRNALERLMEIGVVKGSDLSLAKEVSGGLSDLAKNSPQELLMGLYGAPQLQHDPTTSLLAQGLVRAADSENPLWPALRSAMASSDPGFARFAKALEAELSVKIAQEKAKPQPLITQ